MTLTELLNWITPLPWRKPPVMADVLVIRETLANQEYACHAANVLPETVEASQEVLLNINPGQYPPPKRSLNKLRATITKAQRINPRT
jgi:hypothetical protein